MENPQSLNDSDFLKSQHKMGLRLDGGLIGSGRADIPNREKHCIGCGLFFFPINKRYTFCLICSYNGAKKDRLKNKGWLGLRFKAFKRDNFTCQYCGQKAPKVVLEVDHIIPFSKGGLDKLDNLKTACLPCNRGKSDNS